MNGYFSFQRIKVRKVHNIAMIIKHGVNVDHFLENLDLWGKKNYMKYIIQENLPLIIVSTVI